MNNRLYNVGKIVNTHGIMGELKVLSQTDFPEIRFRKGSKLLLQNPQNMEEIPVTIQTSREHKNTYLIFFQGFNNINQVEKYKGWQLKVSEEYLTELPKGEYYYHEIIGCKVTTQDGMELGEISEVLSTGANDVWVVKRTKGKDVLIPYIDDVVLEVDVENKQVIVELMEGLLEE